MFEEALFKSADAALTFAYNFSGQSYDRPTMNRMADGPSRPGKGLSGLDGAGQAGLIRSEIAELGPFQVAIVTAFYAPHTLPCSCRRSCCSGSRENPEWAEAIGLITQMAIGQLSGHGSNHRLRRGIVTKCFRAKLSIIELADQCNVNRDTASDHNAKIALWLLGYRPKKPGQGQPIVGEIERARIAAGERLHAAGFIGIAACA